MNCFPVYPVCIVEIDNYKNQKNLQSIDAIDLDKPADTLENVGDESSTFSISPSVSNVVELLSVVITAVPIVLPSL